MGVFGPETLDQVPVEPVFPFNKTAVALQVPPADTFAVAFSLTVMVRIADSCCGQYKPL